MKFFSWACFIAIVFFVSCTSQKAVTNNYLYQVRDSSGKSITTYTSPVIQKGDLLSIRVYSKANGLKPQAESPYNLAGEQSASGTASTIGYQVDENGNIEYPQLGILHVEGLTREQLSDLIKNKLEGQLDQPSVIVRFLNFKITVLGEVNHPGTFTVPTERVTILEALGLSGDITDFGKKNNVMVLRENNGVIDRGIINLTSDSMFRSPYFHLQQNDVVLVEQTGRKLQQQQQQNTAQQIGIAISIITAIALILNFIKK